AGRIAGVALDIAECRECIRKIDEVIRLFRVGSGELFAEGDLARVKGNRLIDLTQVCVLLAEVVEWSATKNLVLYVIRRQIDGRLIFGQGFLKCGDRLRILSQLVVQVTQAIPATSERSVMARLVGIRQDELLENLD